MISEGMFLLNTAMDIENKLFILFHFFPWVLSRILKIKFRQKEVKINFKDISFVFKTFCCEFTPYIEIYMKKIYECDPLFIASPGDIVIDAGAHIGIYSIRQAKRGARVYAFEPNPDVFVRLENNISLNSVRENIVPIRKALHSRTGNIEFSIDPDNTAAGKDISLERKKTTSNYIIAESISLDDFMSSIECKCINILKIDIEGNEFELLQGATDSLKIVKKLVLECHSQDNKRNIVNLLSKDFNFRLILEKNNILYFTKQ